MITQLGGCNTLQIVTFLYENLRELRVKVVSILEETFDVMSAVDNASNQESGVNQGRLESLPIA